MGMEVAEGNRVLLVSKSSIGGDVRLKAESLRSYWRNFTFRCRSIHLGRRRDVRSEREVRASVSDDAAVHGRLLTHT